MMETRLTKTPQTNRSTRSQTRVVKVFLSTAQLSGAHQVAAGGVMPTCSQPNTGKQSNVSVLVEVCLRDNPAAESEYCNRIWNINNKHQ